MLMKICGRIRGLVTGTYSENREEEQVQLNARGDLVVAQAMPELTELVRMGNSFQVQTSTAAAALTTEPTTTNGLGLFNGEPSTGKSYAIDSIAAWERVVDATQQNEMALFVMNNKTIVTAPADAALTIRSLSGRTYGGKARTFIGAVTNDGWFPVGNSAPGAPAVAGGVWRTTDIPLRGLYLVPPGGMFNIHAVKVAATASQLQFVIRWHEIQLPVVP